MLEQWRISTIRALADMSRDLEAGRVYDDTLRRDFELLRHMMERHDDLLDSYRRAIGPHRGPGTPNYRQI